MKTKRRHTMILAVGLAVVAASVETATMATASTRHRTTTHHSRHVTKQPTKKPPATVPTVRPTTPVSTTPPSNAASPILFVQSVGGFIAPQTIFVRTPSVVVDATGHVITEGPQTMIFPGPALPNLRVRSLSADALRALRAAAADAGLADAGFDWGLPPTADVPSTVITYRTESGKVVRSDIASFGVGDDRLPAPQAQRRRKVQALLDALTAATAPYGGADAPYVATAFAIRSTPVDPAAAPQTDPKPNKLAWPLPSVALSSATTCAEVRGADAITLRTALAKATQITQWTQAGALWAVAIRPLVVGDAGCSSTS